MNKNISIILLALLLPLAGALSAQNPCIDSSLIDPNAACPAVYDPVCGCDGQTYGNACEATNFFGVTSFVPGECNSGGTACHCEYEFEVELTGLQLHAGFDFGAIDPPFFFYVEWSLNNGEVTGTGLDFVHQVQQPGRQVLCATYPTGDFTNETCTVCKVVEVTGQTCIDPMAIDTTLFCPTVYDPVCGCNGVTYTNSCIALNHYGVTSWTPGVCPDTCLNPAQIDSSVACIEIYDPVCGCDGVTYDNDCFALNYGGVQSWTKGACCPNPACKALFEVEILSGNTLFIKNLSVNAEASLLNFGDGAWHAGVFETLTHTYSVPGSYQICLEISNFAGDCSDTYCLLVNFTSANNEPGKNRPELLASPNPAHTETSVQIIGGVPQQAVLLDLQGKTIWQQSVSTNYFTVNIQTLPSGLYLLQVQTDHGTATRKLVVE